MKITRKTEAIKDLKPMDAANFSGNAASRELVAPTRATLNAFAGIVRFEAGARNHWHSHAGGQVLHVIDGEGWVQSRGQAPERIGSGDTAVSDPGEEHWHGASRQRPMAHLAVAIGETRWLEASPQPPG